MRAVKWESQRFNFFLFPLSAIQKTQKKRLTLKIAFEVNYFLQ